MGCRKFKWAAQDRLARLIATHEVSGALPNIRRMRSANTVHVDVSPARSACIFSMRLDPLGERWVAVVDCQHERHHGIGASAREALVAALAPLGKRTAASVMADPAMFGASLALLA